MILIEFRSISCQLQNNTQTQWSNFTSSFYPTRNWFSQWHGFPTICEAFYRCYPSPVPVPSLLPPLRRNNEIPTDFHGMAMNRYGCLPNIKIKNRKAAFWTPRFFAEFRGWQRAYHLIHPWAVGNKNMRTKGCRLTWTWQVPKKWCLCLESATLIWKTIEHVDQFVMSGVDQLETPQVGWFT